MKLLILSDSHGEQEFMQLAVRRERPDAVIHLGDHCADADRLAEEFCGLPVLSVRGNCDLWGPPRAETLLRTFEGVRIFGTHGHRYGVKQGLLRFSLAAQEQQAQVALFGHTRPLAAESRRLRRPRSELRHRDGGRRQSGLLRERSVTGGNLMILAIDIGNTNVVLGGIEGNDILFEARMATDSIKTSDQYCAELKNILALFDVVPSMIDGTIVASVVPPVLNSFRTAIRKLTGKNCLVVGPGIRTGLNIRMDNPAEIGSDLIVASVAAIHDYGAPLLIVDMGTATTITAIDKDGVYSGGCICPGLKISLEALTGRTAQLPGISLDEPQRAIGKNTRDAMRSGIMFGAAAMLDGLLDRMEQELGTPATVVATGGISKFVVPLCRRKLIYDRTLMLKGLNLLYQRNVRA